LTDSSKDLSPGGRIAVGVALILAGAALSARGGYVLVQETHKLASDAMAIVPVGMVLAFACLLLAVPPRFARLRTFAGAVLITAFALTFDWIAFGPGTRQFGGGVVSGALAVPFRPGEMLGRGVFGVVALVLTLVAVLAWVHGIRRHWRADADRPSLPPL